MRKGEFARLRGWSPANVSKLTKEGGKLAAAVTADGRIDLDQAEIILARDTDPARRLASSLGLSNPARRPADPTAVAAPVPAAAAPEAAEPEQPGSLSGLDGYALARARRAHFDAQSAELGYEERKRTLVGRAGVERGIQVAAEKIAAAIDLCFADLVDRARRAGTSDDAQRVAEAAGRELKTAIADALERYGREALGDA